MSIVIIGLLITLFGIIIFLKVSTTSVTESKVLHNKENVVYISKTIEGELLDLVMLTTTIASSETIKDSLVASNTYYESLNPTTRTALINDLNTTWMNTNSLDDPFIQTRMDNDAATFLKSQQALYPNLYGEIFLTNEYGVMLSTTSKLTTLAHYEKYWWQGAFNNGEGIIYIDDRGFDDSVDGYVLGIVIPIYDDDNKIIGILKSNFNIDYIFENSVANFHSLEDDGKYYIVRTKGLIVDGDNLEPLSERVDDVFLDYLNEKTLVSKELSFNKHDYFTALAPISLTFDSNKIEFGGNYASIDHTNGNLGEGWTVLYLIDKDVALASYNEMIRSTILLIVGLLLFIGIAASIIGQYLSKPFVLLNDYIIEVNKSKLIAGNKGISKDEVVNISESFSIMVDTLKNALQSNRKLDYEKQIAQMYFNVAGVMLLVIDNLGKVVLINKRGCEILGLKEEEIIGKDWFDNFIPKKIAKEMKETFITMMKNSTGDTQGYVNPIINSKGEERLIRWNNVVLYDINKKITRMLSSGEDITEIQRNKEELIKISYEDSLTNIKNRRYYEEVLPTLDKLENYPLTVVMSDINGLKLINDAFGHTAGDKMLVEYAKLLCEVCHDGCIYGMPNSNCIASRIGGDEFVLVLTKTSGKATEKIINKIRKKAEQITIESIPLSISFGYKTKENLEDSLQDIYRSAEDAMYREKLIEIPSMRSGAIETILTTLHEKHQETEIHSRRVSEISEKLASFSGIDRQGRMKVKTAGLLHDIGKIVIPEDILKKDGLLTKEEYELIKTHPEIGFRILNSSKDMRGVSEIVLNHHERWDGKGYPRGIKATEIPLESRIISIADAFDAMTSERTYRDTISNEEALIEIKNNAGTQFDPYLVEIFTNYFYKIIT